MRHEQVTSRNAMATSGNVAHQLVKQMQQICETEMRNIKFPESITYKVTTSSIPHRKVRALKFEVYGQTTNTELSKELSLAFGAIINKSEDLLAQSAENHSYRTMTRRNIDYKYMSTVAKRTPKWQATIYYKSGTKDPEKREFKPIWYIWELADFTDDEYRFMVFSTDQEIKGIMKPVMGPFRYYNVALKHAQRLIDAA